MRFQSLVLTLVEELRQTHGQEKLAPALVKKLRALPNVKLKGRLSNDEVLLLVFAPEALAWAKAKKDILIAVRWAALETVLEHETRLPIKLAPLQAAYQNLVERVIERINATPVK